MNEWYPVFGAGSEATVWEVLKWVGGILATLTITVLMFLLNRRQKLQERLQVEIKKNRRTEVVNLNNRILALEEWLKANMAASPEDVKDIERRFEDDLSKTASEFKEFRHKCEARHEAVNLKDVARRLNNIDKDFSRIRERLDQISTGYVNAETYRQDLKMLLANVNEFRADVRTVMALVKTIA